MDTNEYPTDESSERPAPPAAMPLSMPPVTTPAAPTASTPSDAPGEPPRAPATPPLGAMPLSMPPMAPPARPDDAAVAPTGTPWGGTTGGSGAVPPLTPPWMLGSPDDFSPSATPASAARVGRYRRSTVGLVVAALVAGGLGAGLGSAFGSGSSGSSATGSTNALAAPTSSGGSTKALSVAAIYRLVTPAVVDINTVVATPSSEGESTQAAGTGMIVSSNGIILTNNHVIEDATSIRVTIAGHSGSYPATVLGTSAKNDVALIKVNGFSDLPTVKLGNSSTITVGTSVVAVGNAQGLGGSPSEASGSISALGRTITAGDEGGTAASEQLHNLIETNAQIIPGDSGGPLLDSSGQVIGMDTAASSSDTSSTLGFAIPINEAKSLALAIENHTTTSSNGVRIGLESFLGVESNPTGSTTSPQSGFGFGFGSGTSSGTGTSSTCTVTGSASTSSGVAISDVIIGGPAQKAGLAGGDTITSVNGTAVTSWTALTKAIQALKPGTRASVGYVDGCDTAHTTTVTIAGIPA
jgi:S1-C subfamily serine protease